MKAGAVIGERFAIEKLAGRGGMGAVYRARDAIDGGLAAVKLLRADEADASQKQRFEREARALAALAHPGIVTYLGHGTTADGAPYLAMEWLEGEDLRARLSRGALTVGETVTLGQRVCDALAAAHARGVVHRDLKPANLFLPDGEVGRATLLDFGVARLVDATETLTRTGMALGTPSYMAPEQARGLSDLDARADLYALGAVLFACLAGEPPFAGEHLVAVLSKILFEQPPRVSELRDDVPEALDELVAGLLSKDPEARPEAEAVAEALRALDVERPAGGRARPPVSGAEQRVLCVLLGRGAPMTPALREAVAEHGGEASALADGSVVAAFAAAGRYPTELAVSAARCARAAAEIAPDARFAVATGRGQVDGRVPIGAVIDQAAALVHDTAGSGIRLDETTGGLVEQRFELVERAGGAALGAERALPSGARRLLGKPSPFVGRARELGTLEALLDEVVDDGEPRVALITGPAGAGKSRLCHELVQRMRGRGDGMAVWSAHGDPVRAGSPFGLLGDAVRGALGLDEVRVAETRRERLRARVRDSGCDEPDGVAEFLGELCGVPFDDAASVPLRAARHDPRLRADQMRRAWEDWLAAEAGARPVALVLEDLHWGDEPTVSFVDSALRNLADRPVFVVATARPEVHERFPSLWSERDPHEVRLGKLRKKACAELIRHALGAGVTDGAVAEVIARADGNAFFLEELIRARAEGTELPDSLLAMVEARLAALPDPARRLLRAASVLGQVFWRGACAALAGDDAVAALPGVVDREVVTEQRATRFAGEVEYEFRHALLRDAAYASLPDDERMRAHAGAAAWLEGHGETDAIVLARHTELAGDRRRAAHWYTRAAHQALDANDFDGVIERADRARACGVADEDAASLDLCCAQAYLWTGDAQRAEPHARAAFDAYPPDGDGWFDAAHYLSWAYGAQMDRGRLLALVDRLLATAKGSIRSLQAIAMARAASWLAVIDGAGKANELLRVAEAGARADPTAAATFAHASAFVATSGSDPERAVRLMHEAADCWRAIGDHRNAALDDRNAANSLLALGRNEEALHHRGLVELGRLGLAAHWAFGLSDQAVALLQLGRADEAGDLIRRAIEVANNPWVEGVCRIYASRIHSACGEYAPAVDEAVRAIDLIGQTPNQAHAQAARARALLGLGRVVEAGEAARDAMRTLDEGGPTQEGEQWFVRLVFVEALVAAGRTDEARAAAATARERLLESADRVRSPELRKSFLENVPETAGILELARELAGEPV